MVVIGSWVLEALHFSFSFDLLEMAEMELTNHNEIIIFIKLQPCSPKIPLPQKFN